MRNIIALLLSTLVLSSPLLAEPKLCLCECDLTSTPTASATLTFTPTPLPTATPTATPSPTPAGVPVPQLAQWEQNMRVIGAQRCAAMKAMPTFDQKLAELYYDAEAVYYQIFEYTQDSNFLSCAETAEQVYRDQYVVANSGNVPGYWNFSRGLRIDYQRAGDQQSKNAIHLLATKMWCMDNSAYSDAELPKVENSRENAYCLIAYLNDEAVGNPVRTRKAKVVDWALGHFDQWFRTPQSVPYVRPFMAGLTAQALILHYQASGDARVLPALATGADWLWANTWLPADESFMYTDRVAADGSGGKEPAPDLNLLIAPWYGFLWKETGEPKWRDRFDAIFAGGVKRADLGSGKRFDQNYWWSFDGIAWRRSR